MTAHTGQLVRGIFIIVFAVGLLGWFVMTTIRRAEDPARMIFKWILTFLVVGAMVWKVAPIVGQGGYSAAFYGIPLTAVCGLCLAFIWRYNLASLIAHPFASLYDGGTAPPEPCPAYSVAQSKQKKGQYLEAALEVRKQLERFPTDLEGHMLLAQIQAEDLKDLPAAELTIERLCAQPGHAPKNITFALFSLADWHLKFGLDREAARHALERVIELLPESEFALTAAQRIAHLGNAELLLAPHERKKFAVREGIKNVGLAKDLPAPNPAEEEPGQVAAECVRHLEQHPLDTDAREKLAMIYAGHYGRLDLAADQLEQMIQQPNQPARLIVRWLNLLADLQIRCGADYDAIRQTLQRIIDRDPNFAAAENARKRINLIKVEMKGKQKNQAVKLGTYEQNIGLKQSRSPNQPPE